MAKPSMRCRHCGRLLFLFYHPTQGYLYGHASKAAGKYCRMKQAQTAQKEQESCKTTTSK